MVESMSDFQEADVRRAPNGEFAPKPAVASAPGTVVDVTDAAAAEFDDATWQTRTDESFARLAPNYESAGVPADEARAWHDRNFYPGEAAGWRDCGFGPDEAAAWADEGGFLVAAEADQWRAQGWTPERAGRARRTGLTALPPRDASHVPDELYGNPVVGWWESKSGDHWVAVKEHEDGTFSFSTSHQAGGWAGDTEEEVFAEFNRQARLGRFQPDGNTTPMIRLR